MIKERKLPIGIQDFEDLRTNDYVYVDKTAYVYRMVTMGKPYFLGRPRRFGKSLLLSTLKAYFLGKKELFEGLAIAELEKDWIKYPVFHIDMNVGIITDVDSLYRRLDVVLKKLENQWGRVVDDNDPASRLEGLIYSACEQTGRKVVVLIDEYDKPLLDTMDDIAVNNQIRKVLSGFYGVLKSTDAYLRFVFLTGITKFSKVSIFSELNHLKDISMNKVFAAICGISEAELIRDFEPELQILAEETGMTRDEAFAKMKKLYDGYHFAKKSEDIYNPFSVLNTFDNRDFAYYWFETGTPTYLIKMIKDADMDIRKIDDGDISIAANSITDYRIESKDPVPLLYQSGYLTIKSFDSRFNIYNLGFPNEEVKYGFLERLLLAYLPATTLNEFFADKFVKELEAGDVEGFMTSIKAYFSGISYDSIFKTEEDKAELRYERHYQLVFYLLFTMMGQFIDMEVKSSYGRADAVVKTANAIYVFEFKMDTNASAEAALKQINDKDYMIPYTADGRKLVKIGVEFSEEKRGPSRWAVEEN